MQKRSTMAQFDRHSLNTSKLKSIKFIDIRSYKPSKPGAAVPMAVVHSYSFNGVDAATSSQLNHAGDIYS